ncbi:hypothetical protein KZY48_004785 [Vibrio parahaemolyticus]|uniref:hypothetical protein n=2 Tax=Vibrio parahaemolyticus TaxID=670 RepID=UPI001A253432|nr:hypothetical protein [Vibrio parahaemolyticus]EGQ8486257.1 hypothetical protein [Vibrio parahaemolyticus]EGQ8902852.1 hypothetical protein [Vibrio parahaemolyticus]EGQ8922496.1 hypothetical protein [Vibrio parahaemolyticus]EGQ9707571.1 hypothetical protein [Vibrio parahaemolyticus]EGR1690179.1 hypothetical protein [Vibrio parahaemolyticus]
MATEQEVDRFLDLVNEITELTIDDLIYDSKWGSINFEKAKADLTRLYALCNHFKVLPLEQLPSDIAQQMVSQGTPIRNTVKNIREYTIEQENPSGVRDQYISQVQTQVDQFYKFAHIYVPYLAYQKGEIQNNIEQLTTSVSQAKKLLENAEVETKAKSGEIESIIQAAREASASAGVAHFTADFEQESSTLEVQAKIWLKATVSLAAISLAFALYFLFSDPDISSVAKAIQFISSKVLILVLLIMATLWCGNMYKATKHQAAANKFKGNSLKTFQAFVKATDDDSVRDAVLVETTRAIFNESATGYLNVDSSTTEKSTKVVEVIRTGVQAATAASKS